MRKPSPVDPWGQVVGILGRIYVQTTVVSSVTFTGNGLHSGMPVTMVVRPAVADHGIQFQRVDLPRSTGLIDATWDNVVPSRLCTRISNEHDVEVSTIEHIMAALAGCGVQNVLIEIDGPEVPILDGSSALFVEGLLSVGIQELDTEIRIIEILEEVVVRDGDAVARLSPKNSFEIKFHIDFEDAAIGRQEKTLNMANGAFVRELCDSRTFCRQADVDLMRKNGLALGGTMSNAVVVDGDSILTPGGLRRSDEAVRHKMLDALGDLATAGSPIIGRYTGHRAGHAMTNKLLRALFANPDAYRVVTCDAKTARRLPGVGVQQADIPAVA